MAATLDHRVVEDWDSVDGDQEARDRVHRVQDEARQEFLQEKTSANSKRLEISLLIRFKVVKDRWNHKCRRAFQAR